MKIELKFNDDKKCKDSSSEFNLTIEDDIFTKTPHVNGWGRVSIDVELFESTFSELLHEISELLTKNTNNENYIRAINAYKFEDKTLSEIITLNENKRNEISNDWYEFTLLRNSQDANWNIELSNMLGCK